MLVCLSIATVTLAGVFLLGLGLLAFMNPAVVRRFLLGFAATAARHYCELAVRIAVGTALMGAAPRMAGSETVSAAGLVLVATSLFMLLIPWRAHHAFAQRSVPQAMRFLPAIGLVSVAAGTALLWATYGAGAV